MFASEKFSRKCLYERKIEPLSNAFWHNANCAPRGLNCVGRISQLRITSGEVVLSYSVGGVACDKLAVLLYALLPVTCAEIVEAAVAIVGIQRFDDFLVRLDADHLAGLQIERLSRHRRSLRHAVGPDRIRHAADRALVGVIDPAHGKANADPCFGNGAPGGIQQALGELGQLHVARGVVLDELPHIPPGQRLGGKLHLRVLADIGLFRLAGSGRDSDARMQDVFGAAGTACGRRNSGTIQRRLRLDPLQPGFLPEDQAAGLAAVMRRSVAADVRQMNGVGHLAAADPECGIAGLVRALADHHPGAAISQHLRHERHLVEPAVGIEGSENFFPRADLHPFAGLEAEHLLVAHGGALPKKVQ